MARSLLLAVVPHETGNIFGCQCVVAPFELLSLIKCGVLQEHEKRHDNRADVACPVSDFRDDLSMTGRLAVHTATQQSMSLFCI